MEFTLCLPLLLLLIFSIVDFGLIYYQLLEVSNATRTGARVGAQRKDDGHIRSVVDEYSPHSHLTPENIQISVTTMAGDELPSGNRQPGAVLTVTVAFPIEGITPLRGLLNMAGLNAYMIRSAYRVEQSS